MYWISGDHEIYVHAHEYLRANFSEHTEIIISYLGKPPTILPHYYYQMTQLDTHQEVCHRSLRTDKVIKQFMQGDLFA